MAFDELGPAFEIVPESPLWPAQVPQEANIASKIYGRGDCNVLQGPCISIIGARKATPYGLAVAEMAGRVSAECGVVVVSGGALGCDAAAARAAMKAGGKTVVVSGCGADTVYPASSRDVFENAIATGGCVVSLEPWGTPPQRFAFPKRNRLIAALSHVLIVTEAGLKSGTMSTAHAAAELGRTIFAIPGSIFSPTSRGTNALLEDGATIIVDDTSLECAIAREYGVLRLISEHRTPDHGRVLSALLAMPMRSDDLAAALGEHVLTVIKTLASYEAEGLVVKLPDGRFAPSERVLLGDTRPQRDKGARTMGGSSRSRRSRKKKSSSASSSASSSSGAEELGVGERRAYGT
jgi:DNA processing protein